ncbi:hypothetical protein [Wenzhouxiangella sp. EGI_FJ10409]|uniref:hypothetical protein n=1 Tax=Wenzhouxiangella sp. EGI_FJ10409 TaxID=3243767 RepID=UPI0035DDE0B7
MVIPESEFDVMEVVKGLRLSETALTGCQSEPEKAFPAILIGWQVVVKNCLTSAEKWKLENSPPEATLLAEIEEIYSTNWPNRQICRALRTFYDADPQDWWEIKDVRGLLDLAIRSALEAAYASTEHVKEHDWSDCSD